jgi:hypothetical protein
LDNGFHVWLNGDYREHFRSPDWSSAVTCVDEGSVRVSAFAAIKWARSAPVVRRSDGRPDATAHHVLLALATFADKEGRARPSVTTLAEATMLATDTVDAALCRLVEAGVIAAGESFGGTGCVVWTLNTGASRATARVDLMVEQQERKRRATAERVRRWRERRNGATDRHVTVSNSVTDEDVTLAGALRNGVGCVTSGDVTVSETVTSVTDCVTPAGPGLRSSKRELEKRTSKRELPPTASARRTRKRYDYTPDFEAFWSAYGRVGDKSEAFVQWLAAIERASPLVIMDAVGPYVASTWDPQFRKGAQRWLGNDCWESRPVVRAQAVNGHRPYQNPIDQSLYDDPI